MKHNQYNAHHAPVGAFASFTLGYPGAKGGFGLELGKPADQNVYIGMEGEGNVYRAFPFFEVFESESSRYDVEQAEHESPGIREASRSTKAVIQPFSEYERDFHVCTDTFAAKDIQFTIASHSVPLPDPAGSSDQEMMDTILPAVLFQVTIDNTRCSTSRRGFLGYTGNDPYTGMVQYTPMNGNRLTGIGQGISTAFFTRDPDVKTAIGFTMEEILSQPLTENWATGLGQTGALIFDVPAGQQKTYSFVAAFYRSGIATAGMKSTYFYTHYFEDIEAVGAYALEQYDQLLADCYLGDSLTEGSSLSEDQKWMMTHAIRSYYGSTQLLMDQNQKPLWIVNEGEYRMMNTFDLTVDQLFFEMKMNPWTVKNELDLFADRYSYRDYVSFPGDSALYRGGVSFTHDMGVSNVFAPGGHSSYEMHGLKGCFSQMTHEQLVNWVLCAAVYIHESGDLAWRDERLPLLRSCLESMLQRDHPNPARRNGIMKLDSSRVMGGAEITTYDSLDVSLGQARNNIYLAGKCWAAYVSLEKIFSDTDCEEESAEASVQAKRCANTLCHSMSTGGFIPAVLEHGNQSKIIPAIEGLVFPYFTGCKDALDPKGPYREYLSTLTIHLNTILTPGACLFQDHGWKLSSTSNNSWLSKIYLCQFVAYKLLGIPRDEQAAQADRAHVSWLLDPKESYYAWSDQMMSGVAIGSKYYPRGVTSILWLLL